MVRRQVHARRSFDILRLAQHLRTYYYVLVLYARSYGPTHEEVPVVEEVPYYFTDGPVRGYHGARLPTAVHRLRLPASVRLVDRHARRHVLLPFQRLLQPVLL